MTQPFEGLRVYYSGTIKGSPEPDPELPWKLVRFMADRGADVLSEHVAARTPAEMDEIRARRIGRTIQQLYQEPEPWIGVRRQDLQWVNEADCVVALVNAPSSGVGMELQRAIDKPGLGMNQTPILCLVRSDVLPRLSFMVHGITPEENPGSEIKEYVTTEEVQQYIFDFLSRRKTEKETGQPRSEMERRYRTWLIDKPENLPFMEEAAAGFGITVSVLAKPGETYPCDHGVLGTVKEGDICIEIVPSTREQDLRAFWLRVGSLKKAAALVKPRV